jgi:hypothetical protein
MMVHHTAPIEDLRSQAYSRSASLDKAWDAAKARGWMVTLHVNDELSSMTVMSWVMHSGQNAASHDEGMASEELANLKIELFVTSIPYGTSEDDWPHESLKERSNIDVHRKVRRVNVKVCLADFVISDDVHIAPQKRSEFTQASDVSSLEKKILSR